jgi:hypothetical protein
VQVARDRLAAMTDMHNRPRLPPNPLSLASFDALWRKFGMPNSDEIEHNGPEDRPQDRKELTKWRKELRYMMSLTCYRRRERSIGATS